MDALRICLFGGVRVSHTLLSIELKLTRTIQALFAYLLLQGNRFLPRDVLAVVCWGDQPEERARLCLNTALWRLRGLLEPKGVERGTYLLTTPTGEVAFNWSSNHWLDVTEFEGQVSGILARPAETMGPEDAAALEQALDLYAGDLLEGFYEDWALRERERLRTLYLNSLARLMTYYGRVGAYEQSLLHGQAILAHDPLREEIHREMMRLYVRNGQRALAVRQYEACREALAAELGIDPMPETQALHAEILKGSPPMSLALTSEARSGKLSGALGQLRRALENYDRARADLEQAITSVERLIDPAS